MKLLILAVTVMSFAYGQTPYTNMKIFIDTSWVIRYVDTSVIDTSTVTVMYEKDEFVRVRKVFKLGFRTESNVIRIRYRESFYDSVWYLDRGMRFNERILMEFKK